MTASTKEIVSVIIPCRNEAKYMGKCLDSIIANDFPNEALEILVVDGLSDDGTVEIVSKYCQKHRFINYIQNDEKIVPSALNIGIKRAKGEIIIRMDAHNIYARDYISKCAYYLNKYKVDNVGGILITQPGVDTVIAKSIALAVSHPFGVGNAHFRIGTKEPKYVDTVPFGCYRKELFEKIGYFDEDLIRNQDDEFNSRLIKNGGQILLVPDIISCYYARDSLLKLWYSYYQYGHFKPLVSKKVGSICTLRQLVPVVFITFIIILGISSLLSQRFLWPFLLLLVIYLTVNVAVSLKLGINKGLKYSLVLPVVFSDLHFSYGLGYLKGIIDFNLLNKHNRNKLKDVPLTR